MHTGAFVGVDHGEQKVRRSVPRRRRHVAENPPEAFRLQSRQLARQRFAARGQIEQPLTAIMRAGPRLDQARIEKLRLMRRATGRRRSVRVAISCAI